MMHSPASTVSTPSLLNSAFKQQDADSLKKQLEVILNELPTLRKKEKDLRIRLERVDSKGHSHPGASKINHLLNEKAALENELATLRDSHSRQSQLLRSKLENLRDRNRDLEVEKNCLECPSTGAEWSNANRQSVFFLHAVLREELATLKSMPCASCSVQEINLILNNLHLDTGADTAKNPLFHRLTEISKISAMILELEEGVRKHELRVTELNKLCGDKEEAEKQLSALVLQLREQSSEDDRCISDLEERGKEEEKLSRELDNLKEELDLENSNRNILKQNLERTIRKAAEKEAQQLHSIQKEIECLQTELERCGEEIALTEKRLEQINAEVEALQKVKESQEARKGSARKQAQRRDGCQRLEDLKRTEDELAKSLWNRESELATISVGKDVVLNQLQQSLSAGEERLRTLQARKSETQERIRDVCEEVKQVRWLTEAPGQLADRNASLEEQLRILASNLLRIAMRKATENDGETGEEEFAEADSKAPEFAGEDAAETDAAAARVEKEVQGVMQLMVENEMLEMLLASASDHGAEEDVSRVCQFLEGKVLRLQDQARRAATCGVCSERRKEISRLDELIWEKEKLICETSTSPDDAAVAGMLMELEEMQEALEQCRKEPDALALLRAEVERLQTDAKEVDGVREVVVTLNKSIASLNEQHTLIEEALEKSRNHLAAGPEKRSWSLGPHFAILLRQAKKDSTSISSIDFSSPQTAEQVIRNLKKALLNFVNQCEGQRVSLGILEGSVKKALDDNSAYEESVKRREEQQELKLEEARHDLEELNDTYADLQRQCRKNAARAMTLEEEKARLLDALSTSKDWPLFRERKQRPKREKRRPLLTQEEPQHALRAHHAPSTHTPPNHYAIVCARFIAAMAVVCLSTVIGIIITGALSE